MSNGKLKSEVGRKNGATGRSDIEGKAVRVTASDIGSERVSIKKEEALRNADCGLRSGDIFDIRVSLADEGDVMFSAKG